MAFYLKKGILIIAVKCTRVPKVISVKNESLIKTVVLHQVIYGPLWFVNNNRLLEANLRLHQILYKV